MEEDLGFIRWRIEEDRRGEREEKKNLKAKREVEREGKERRDFEAIRTDLRYELGLGFWRRGVRSMKRTMRCVFEKSIDFAIEIT